MQNDREEIAVGLDLYIDARIKEKKTGRIISRGHNDSYYVEPEGFLRYAGGVAGIAAI